jgi:hypothetical protein
MVFPENAERVEVSKDFSTFSCFMPAETKTVVITNSVDDFMFQNCLGTNAQTGAKKCPYYTDRKEVKKYLQQQGVVPTDVRIDNYLIGSNLCSATYSEVMTCKAGKKFHATEEITIQIPRTIWMTSSKWSPKTRFRIYDYKPANGEFYIKPFRLSNMFEDGSICFGKQNKTPASLREAYIIYYNSIYNKMHAAVEDNTPLADKLRNYDPEQIPGEWEKYDPDEQLCEYATTSKIDGVLIDKENNLYWIRSTLSNNWILISPTDNNIHIKSGQLSTSSKIERLGPIDWFTV